MQRISFYYSLAVLNETSRGCVDTLPDVDFQFCLKNEKFCSLCYTNDCNDKMAPNNANMIRFNIFNLLFLNICSIIVIQKFKNLYFI